MSFTTLTVTQKSFLETHLRGTGVEMSASQANTTYGIQNLRARISELRTAGLIIRKRKNYAGRAAYSVSARDIYGSRAKLAV